MIAKFKNDNLHVKVRRKMRQGFAPDDYSKIVNLKDSNDLCFLFEDLCALFDAPVESAFRKLMERKNKNFPF